MLKKPAKPCMKIKEKMYRMKNNITKHHIKLTMEPMIPCIIMRKS